jgi:hypothetical protein
MWTDFRVHLRFALVLTALTDPAPALRNPCTNTHLDTPARVAD